MGGAILTEIETPIAAGPAKMGFAKMARNIPKRSAAPAMLRMCIHSTLSAGQLAF
jgi:hypothetical protein